ncbi:very short patch repair endonuclease [Methylobacterium radiotolerans]|nr:very short patch repair endonuclease [Methylobacterium radiotolerans]
MADRLTPNQRSNLMRQVKGKDTRPEKIVRSLLHRLGYRFRLQRKDLPGTPDIVFPGRRVALFVHGCFWHGHGCRLGQLPKTRLEYWQPKIDANRNRDKRTAAALELAGWRVAVVWQCELGDMAALSARLRSVLGNTPLSDRRVG